ncbi:MAG: hypothetical protein KDD62_00470, partial [Bdellovibrionales bacterium]|nr:hypothetical protein [Bdellovibrionales bacterium]
LWPEESCQFPGRREYVALSADTNGSLSFGVAAMDNCPYQININQTGYTNFLDLIHPNYNADNITAFTAKLKNPDAFITIDVIDQTGQVLPLAPENWIDVYCYEANVSDPEGFGGGLYYDNGTQIKFGVTNGTYSCNASLFVQNGSYNIQLSSQTVTVSNSQNPPPLKATIKAFTENLKVSIFDSPNNLHFFDDTSGEYGTVWCNNLTQTLYFDHHFEPGDTGSATMGITPGKWFCNFAADGYISKEVTVNVGANQKNIPVSFTLQSLDSVINVKLFDQNGNPYTQHLEPPHVYCDDAVGTNTISFFGEGTPGASSFSFNAIDGQYNCYLHLPGFAGEFSTVTVSGSGLLNFTLSQPLDGEVHVTVVDAISKQLITGLSLDYFIHPTFEDGQAADTETHFYQGMLSDTGEASFQVPSGVKLEVGIAEAPEYFGADFPAKDSLKVSETSNAAQSSFTIMDESGELYFIPYQPKSFTASSSGVTEVQFELVKPTTFVNVTLLDPAGNPVTEGFVDAVSFDFEDGGSVKDGPPSDFDEDDHFLGSHIGSDGYVRLPLLADRQYEIIAMPFFEEGSRLIPPPIQRVTLEEGEQRDTMLQMKEANHDLTINIEVDTSSTSIQSDTVQFTNCFAFQEGVPVFLPKIEGDSTTIPLYIEDSQTSWEVGCHRVIGDEESGIFKSFVGHSFYIPIKDTTTGSITITLSEDDDYYPNEELTFPVDQDVTLGVHDLRISIPATAFGSSGTGKLRIGSATGITYSDDSRPTLAFDFTWTVDGQEVSNPSLPITVRFPIDLAKLTKLGVSIDSLFAGHFNSDTNKWVKDGAISISTATDPDTGEEKTYATITMSSFSIWGTIVSKGKELKASVSSELKAKPKTKKIKGTKVPSQTMYVLSWTAPTGSTASTKFEIDVRLTKKASEGKSKSKKKKKKKKKKDSDTTTTDDWSKAKTYSTTETSITKKFSVGNTYEYRVRVSGGKNSFTKTFKVKAPKVKQ